MHTSVRCNPKMYARQVSVLGCMKAIFLALLLVLIGACLQT